MGKLEIIQTSWCLCPLRNVVTNFVCWDNSRIWYNCYYPFWRILLAACRKSVITIICLILGIPTAWLILDLMANNLALVVITLTAWWIILIIGLLYEWMCDIEVATWFLILVSEITTEEKGLEETLKVILLRFLIWFLMFWV